MPDYWVVDADAEAFDVWRPGDDRSTLIDETLAWHPAGAPEPLVFSVREFFAGVADEDRLRAPAARQVRAPRFRRTSQRGD